MDEQPIPHAQYRARLPDIFVSLRQLTQILSDCSRGRVTLEAGRVRQDYCIVARLKDSTPDAPWPADLPITVRPGGDGAQEVRVVKAWPAFTEEPESLRYAIGQTGRLHLYDGVDHIEYAYRSPRDFVSRTWALAALRYFRTQAEDDVLVCLGGNGIKGYCVCLVRPEGRIHDTLEEYISVSGSPEYPPAMVRIRQVTVGAKQFQKLIHLQRVILPLKFEYSRLIWGFEEGVNFGGDRDNNFTILVPEWWARKSQSAVPGKVDGIEVVELPMGF